MNDQELLNATIDYLIENGFADNEENACVIIEHSSPQMLDQLLSELAPLAAAGAKLVAGAAKGAKLAAGAAKAAKGSKAISRLSKAADYASTAKDAASSAANAVSSSVKSGGVSHAQSEEIEIICDYLIAEGYASTGGRAENIYDHMSEEWKQSILKAD